VHSGNSAALAAQIRSRVEHWLAIPFPGHNPIGNRCPWPEGVRAGPSGEPLVRLSIPPSMSTARGDKPSAGIPVAVFGLDLGSSRGAWTRVIARVMVPQEASSPLTRSSC
jgi:hypothetical protein